MLHAMKLTSKKTSTESRINRKNMKIGIRNPIITPATKIRMTSIQDVTMLFFPLLARSDLEMDDGYAQ